MSELRLALDLGTTTLAGRLLDAQGRTLAEGKVANPQRSVGSDIIRRLEAALGGEGQRLQALLLEGVATLLDDLLRSAGARREQVAAAALAANPGGTMSIPFSSRRTGREISLYAPLLFPLFSSLSPSPSFRYSAVMLAAISSPVFTALPLPPDALSASILAPMAKLPSAALMVGSRPRCRPGQPLKGGRSAAVNWRRPGRSAMSPVPAIVYSWKSSAAARRPG